MIQGEINSNKKLKIKDYNATCGQSKIDYTCTLSLNGY